ncbi:MAG: PKD domain-containing protein, partial [Bacteroidetes bacterium]|nr:PKD domain-containing protein [Bacteroidota bacterium]
WDFGDGAVSTQQNDTHTYAAVGSYSSELLVVTADGCRDSLTRNVVVDPLPVADFTVVNICEEDAAVFTDLSTVNTGTIVQWYWQFGDSYTDNAQNPVHGYPAGNYTITMEVTTDKGCTDTVQGGVTIYPEPLAGFNFVPKCEDDDTVFFTDASSVATGAITAWWWDLGDGTSQTVQNPYNVYDNPGFYNAVLIVTTDNNCNDTVTQQVEIYAKPLAFFIAPPVCEGVQTLFSDQSNAFGDNIATWDWNFGDGTGTSLQQNPAYLYSTYGVYDDTLIITTDKGCLDTATAQVTVFSLPDTKMSMSAVKGCSPLSIQFTDLSTDATGNITGWIWDFGDGTPGSNDQNPLYTYSTPGTYTITFQTTTSNGCSRVVTYPDTIEVYPLPVAAFIYWPYPPLKSTILYPTVHFTDMSVLAVDWLWELGDGDTSDAQHPIHTYLDTGRYLVRLTVKTNKGCIDFVEGEIYIEPDFEIFIPNAFTPNDDDINDVFKVSAIGIKTIKMYIFDRWGDEIFRSEDVNAGWDGKANKGSGIVQNDVYIFKIEIRDVLDKKHSFVGHVTVVK